MLNRQHLTVCLRVGIACLFSAVALSQWPDAPVRAVTDPGVVTTRQALSPAGVQAVVRGRVYGVAFGESSDEILLSTDRAYYRFNWKSNTILTRHDWDGIEGMQSLSYDPAGHQALTVVAVDRKSGRAPGLVLFAIRNGSTTRLLADFSAYTSGSFTVASHAHLAVIPLTYENRLAVIDLHRQQLIGKFPTGVAPFGAAVNSAGTTAYVTNWGGRQAHTSDLIASTGNEPLRELGDPRRKPDSVVIDSRGIAATGTVSRVNISSKTESAEIAVGLGPTAIVWDEVRNRLYVANSNDDSLSIIDTSTDKVVGTIALQPFAQPAKGVAPTALALTSDGKILFVACGGINAVALLNTATGTIDGLVPTGWYPASLALSGDGKYLAVGTLFGVGAGAKQETSKRSVFAERGTVHIIELPLAAQLANYTTAVAENNHVPLRRSQEPVQARQVTPLSIPARFGEPSPIKHVVFIVKENRTYDQVLGDMKKGNGDPSLVMYGEDVTPNHHRLADQFVLLDNFYATSRISADGHQWLTQANETAYAMWPGYEGRSYPFDGTDPISYSKGGFIWDLAQAHQKTVRVYGEFTPAMNIALDRRREYLNRSRQGGNFASEFQHHSPIPPLERIMAHNYPGYTNAVPDQVRAQILLSDLKSWEENGSMPDLALVQLNCDHTVGTTPGISTPKAMVADNDLALGRVVEALSRSRFWPKMAVFVVEDDAQDGVDHVDGHRTVALAISPYTRRRGVDSTFYSHQSILKSIELILGLPTLSLFDLIANDMRNAFTTVPDLTPYRSVEPEQSLFEENSSTAQLHRAERNGAIASSRMHFEIPDAAPEVTLNQILWHNARGWNVPYPRKTTAIFAPMWDEE
jgi:YVTN family beta-propeller protein